MEITLLKAEMLKFPQIKLNEMQQKSLLFQCEIRQIQHFGRATANTQQSTLMKGVESNIIALFSSNYEELHVLQLFHATYAPI